MKGTYEGSLPFTKMEFYLGAEGENNKVELSFLSLGLMHEKCESVEVHEGKIKFKLPVNEDRWIFEIFKEEDEYKGKLKLSGKDSEFKLNKISDECVLCKTYKIIPEGNREILVRYKEFLHNSKKSPITYELNNEEVRNFLAHLGFEKSYELSMDGALEIMKKVSKEFKQDGINYTNSKEYGTISNIKEAIKNKGYTNCRGMAIILSGILRAYNFRAGHVTCFPYEAKDYECHVVVEVYIEEYKKFVMLDPSLNLVLYKERVPQNLLEIRNAVIENESLRINEDGSISDVIEYLGYLSKNLFCIQKCIRYNEKEDAEGDNSITLVPLKFKGENRARITRITREVKEMY